MASPEFNVFFDSKFASNVTNKKVSKPKRPAGSIPDQSQAPPKVAPKSQNEKDSKSFLSVGVSSSKAKPEDIISHKKNVILKQLHPYGSYADLEGNQKGQLRPLQNLASRNTSTDETPPLSPCSCCSETMTTPSTSVGYSSILPPTPEHMVSTQKRWSICDDLDGDQLDTIAKGLRSNERLPKLKKGVKIAGRRIGKAKPKRRKKEKHTEPSSSGCRSWTKKSGNKATRSGNPHSQIDEGSTYTSRDELWPQRQEHQGKKRRKRRRKRPENEPPPEGQVRRNELLHKLATNPCHLDPIMEHNKTVHTQFGGHITELTEPQPKIRRRRRSNSVKDPQMDFDL